MEYKIIFLCRTNNTKCPTRMFLVTIFEVDNQTTFFGRKVIHIEKAKK